ncbi:MAG: ABC transporter permease [Candidatus Competibacterales bacterium]
MDFSVIDWGLFVEGFDNTAVLVGAALAIGLAIAVPLAVVGELGPWPLRIPVAAYTYVFRGTPLLVQMYLIYYGLGQFETVRDSAFWPILREAYWCALIAFTLNTAAYTTVILQGAIRGTDRGEVEAAKACGMSWGLRMRRIVLPSAWRRALPAYGNEVIFMLHGSAIAGVITIIDLTGAARLVYSQHYRPFEPFLTAAAFYLVLTFLVVGLFKLLEHRLFGHLRPRRSQ